MVTTLKRIAESTQVYGSECKINGHVAERFYGYGRIGENLIGYFGCEKCGELYERKITLEDINSLNDSIFIQSLVNRIIA